MQNLKQGGYLISKIHQLSDRIFTKKLKSFNITEINPAQGRILFALWQNDNISSQELASKTGLGNSTLTRMLDRLENSGHIMRNNSLEDRRKISIKLTQKNKNIKKKYKEVSIKMTNCFYEGFTELEIKQFESFLTRIYENLLKEENQ